MSNNQETYVISLKDVNFMAGMKAAQDAAETTKQKVNGVSGAMDTLKGVVAGFSIAYVGNEIVDTLAKFEKFEAVLTNTLGSNSAAKKALSDITDFAAKTPFEVDELTDSFVRLANQGFTPTMSEMTKLGDVASSKGKDMTQLAEALIDAQVGEFERLKEFGVRAKKSGDQVSFTFKGQTKTVKMTDDAIKDYILSLGDLQGVSGSMASISATTGGQISNLSDTFTQMYLVIGEKLKPQISAVISGLSSLVGGIVDFVNWVTGGSTGAAIFATVVGTLAAGFLTYQAILTGVNLWTTIVTAAQWLWNAALTANPIGIVVVAIGALIGGLVVAYQKFDGFRAIVDGTWAVLKQVGSNIMGMFSKIPEMIIKAFTQIPEAIKSIFSGVGELFNAIFGDGKLEDIPKILKGIGGGILKANPITGFASNVFDESTKGTGDAFNTAYDKSLADSKKAKSKKEKEDFVNSKGAATGAGAGAGAGKSDISGGISEVRASAPKTFNINIESLIKEQNFTTQNITESASKIKEAVVNAMLTAVNDSQIIAE
jgi:hypothetical protein